MDKKDREFIYREFDRRFLNNAEYTDKGDNIEMPSLFSQLKIYGEVREFVVLMAKHFKKKK